MIINVMSKDAAEQASYRLSDRTAVISVTNPGEGPACFCESRFLVAVKPLCFADTSVPSEGAFSRELAMEVREFLQSVIGRIGRLIVHCEFGVSRSAGIAAAILETLSGDASPILDDSWYVPNRLCYGLMKEVLSDPPLIGRMPCEFRDSML